jgi:hypothetical protein
MPGLDSDAESNPVSKPKPFSTAVEGCGAQPVALTPGAQTNNGCVTLTVPTLLPLGSRKVAVTETLEEFPYP